ncbi:MAG: hypothetical protein OEZ01_00135 [Candidatus Heimdallarchaeota archaeon]|nr:hypothetical protein [Candidatus Heimdallarchaeota archaeon]
MLARIEDLEGIIDHMNELKEMFPGNDICDLLNIVFAGREIKPLIEKPLPTITTTEPAVNISDNCVLKHKT